MPDIIDTVERELRGYLHGEPKDAVNKLRERLGLMLKSRSPNSIKEQIPSLVRLVERIVVESTFCPNCDIRGDGTDVCSQCKKRVLADELDRASGACEDCICILEDEEDDLEKVVEQEASRTKSK